jgi:DNA-binding transcriptional LysR family regulator
VATTLEISESEKFCRVRRSKAYEFLATTGGRKFWPVSKPASNVADGGPKHPGDLRSHALLTYGFLLTGNQWKLTGRDGEHWIQPEWTLCANNAEVLRDAAIKGRGVALLPTFITAASLRDGTLRSFLDDYNAPPLALYALYPPTRHLAVKVRLFIDFLVDRFSNFPSWDQKV